MPYFKDTENNLHWLDDVKFSYFLHVGSVQITDEEAEEIRLSQIPEETEEEKIIKKKASILKASDDALKSGALNRILWGIIEMTITEVSKLPAASGLTRELVISALTTPGSQYYNEDFKKTYDQYSILKALIDSDPA